MKIFGIPIPFTEERTKSLTGVDESRGGWVRVLESFAGAWQQNVTVEFNSALSYHAIYACVTLIASDIAKLRVKLVQQDNSGIWTEVDNPSYSPVLRKPNHFQTRIQFWESWILSKLLRGNTYVLKARDNRNVVTALYVLDPNRVQPLVADNGDVFYRLSCDRIAGLEETSIVVPAREIIHDRWNCLFHPLVGTSPIFACGVAAMQGLAIQNNQARFFANRSTPGGILTAPGAISDATATRLKEAWTANYSGENAGKLAVVGDGLKFESMAMSAVDSQLVEQLKWSGEVVCSVFHVPTYKVGIGPIPPYGNIQAANIEYYSQALQRPIEDAEVCLDEGLGMKPGIGTEFDIDGLLRMDSATQMTVLKDGVAAGIYAPNEARKIRDLGPVAGGETPYLQQQNYSLAALAKRDAKEDPFGTAAPAPKPNDTPALPPPKSFDPIKVAKALEDALAA